MANKIILKKSSVVAKVPLATDLDVGELAVNLVDQKLYSKKADGTVVLVGSGLGGSGDVQGAASSTDNAIVRFNGANGKIIKNSSATLDDSGNATMNSLKLTGTGALTIPVGTTAQRPAAPTDGMIRKNSDTDYIEYYDETLAKWISIGAIVATGGTITTAGGYTIHTFTSSGSFTVQAGSGTIDILCVAGGGGGGSSIGGGGGAGGMFEVIGLPVSQGAYSVVVGAGGAASAGIYNSGSNGANSSFPGYTAVGGGAGGGNTGASGQGAGAGGSGGGGGTSSATNYAGAAGTTGQGNAGAQAAHIYSGGGGGGKGAAGGVGDTSNAGNGGNGAQSSINGTATYYAGGGGGGRFSGGGFGTGGLGGGGAGSLSGTAQSGTANTGGGGGAGGYSASTGYLGGAGGSGIVIVRYKG